MEKNEDVKKPFTDKETEGMTKLLKINELNQLKDGIINRVYDIFKPRKKHIKNCKCDSCKIKDFVESEFKKMMG